MSTPLSYKVFSLSTSKILLLHQTLHFPYQLACYACLLSCFSHVWLFATLWTASLYPWDSPGKNTGVCCHALLQGTPPFSLPCLAHYCNVTYSVLSPCVHSILNKPPYQPSSNLTTKELVIITQLESWVVFLMIFMYRLSLLAPSTAHQSHYIFSTHFLNYSVI